MSHERSVKIAVAAAKKELGAGWDVVGPKVQEAFICKHVLHIIGSRGGIKEWDAASNLAAETVLYFIRNGI